MQYPKKIKISINYNRSLNDFNSGFYPYSRGPIEHMGLGEYPMSYYRDPGEIDESIQRMLYDNLTID